MSHTFVIFGASGDLTRRKLIPALYRLHSKGRLPIETRVVGISRTPFSDDQWRAKLADSTARFVGDSFDADAWNELAQRIFYRPGNIKDGASFPDLATFLTDLEQHRETCRVYYLSTAPQFYATAIENMGQANMADEARGSRRVVIEKPFGTDLRSAHQLNQSIRQVFDEHQIYRIDHYLGKETVQNLLVLRFANTIFEPIWNRNYIDHVQITVAEEVDVGTRGGYYDSSGVIRDMFQNHLLQLLMITAMEAPAKYEADAIRDEKVKVLHAVRPLTASELGRDTFRGQYEGYRQSEGIDSASRTATYGAVKLWVDNWRWKDVPFYLRSGKAMSCRTTQIVIQFRQPPHMIFADRSRKSCDANRLVIQVQPAEGIQLHFETKVPDTEMKLRQTDLDFSYSRHFRGAMPEAYERLLLDALEGDASLFARADEVETAWSICDPILQHWTDHDDPPLYRYEPGLWGPSQAADWMAGQGRQWFDICPVLE